MINHHEVFAEIMGLIEKGHTVQFTNYLHSFAISKKTVNSFRKSGYEVLKAKDDGIYMMSGKNYVCMNGCKITYR